MACYNGGGGFSPSEAALNCYRTKAVRKELGKTAEFDNNDL